MSNDIEFTFDFKPTLKTREKLQTTVYFVVSGGSDFLLALYTPFVKIEPAKDAIRQKLFAEADATVNRWALHFSSADVALALSAYQSLTVQLRSIVSSEFAIRQVIVRQIIPLTEKITVVPQEPSKPSFADKVLEPLHNAMPAFDAAMKLMEHIKVTNPELYNDPYLGGITTIGVNRQNVVGPQDGKLKLMFATIIGRIMDGGVR